METLSQPSHVLLHSFCIKPKAHFETQLENEEILLLLRAHPVTQLPWIFNGIFLLILLFFVNIFVGSFFSSQQLLFFNIGGFAFIFAYLWFNFLSWFFNVGIITNLRILDVDFHAVISKEITEARLSKVEDITEKTAGYFGALFNYGSVFIQTAGTEANVEFINIPRPTDVVKIINSILPS